MFFQTEGRKSKRKKEHKMGFERIFQIDRSSESYFSTFAPRKTKRINTW